jgi:hypothetical protein
MPYPLETVLRSNEKTANVNALASTTRGSTIPNAISSVANTYITARAKDRDEKLKAYRALQKEFQIVTANPNSKNDADKFLPVPADEELNFWEQADRTQAIPKGYYFLKRAAPMSEYQNERLNQQDTQIANMKAIAEAKNITANRAIDAKSVTPDENLFPEAPPQPPTSVPAGPGLIDSAKNMMGTQGQNIMKAGINPFQRKVPVDPNTVKQIGGDALKSHYKFTAGTQNAMAFSDDKKKWFNMQGKPDAIVATGADKTTGKRVGKTASGVTVPLE